MPAHRQAFPTPRGGGKSDPEGGLPMPPDVVAHRLVMLQHHGAARSWPETSEGCHKGSISRTVGIRSTGGGRAIHPLTFPVQIIGSVVGYWTAV